ncbi:MAG: MFS transporter [Promethearchaeota archaeon]
MVAEIELKQEVIPLKSRMWVSGADAAVALMQTFILTLISYYFISIRGLDPVLAGIGWLIFGFWNMVNDPIFGYITDRTKSKLGRRIPYIRYGAPLIALSYILCWIYWPGSQADQLAMFIQLLVFLFFYDLLYTAVASALYVMPYEMAVSNKARGSIFFWKVIFSVFAMVAPLLLIDIIKPDTNADLLFFQLFQISLGISAGLIIFLSTFFYEEKQFPREEIKVPFLNSLRNTFKNKSFIVFEVISFTIIYVQGGILTGVPFYTSELEMPMMILYAFLGSGIIVGIILFIIRGQAMGVKKALQIMFLIFSAGCFIILFFGRFLVLTMIGFVGLGIGLTGALYLIPLMNGDVIDKDEDMTGQRREGMYAGINSFITKYAYSIAESAFLFIIAIFGYDKDLESGQQPFRVETGIIIGWMLLPALLLLLCFFVIKFYPLAGHEWEKTKLRLAEIHKQKEIETLKKLGYKYVE